MAKWQSRSDPSLLKQNQKFSPGCLEVFQVNRFLLLHLLQELLIDRRVGLRVVSGGFGSLAFLLKLQDMLSGDVAVVPFAERLMYSPQVSVQFVP